MNPKISSTTKRKVENDDRRKHKKRLISAILGIEEDKINNGKESINIVTNYKYDSNEKTNKSKSNESLKKCVKDSIYCPNVCTTQEMGQKIYICQYKDEGKNKICGKTYKECSLNYYSQHLRKAHGVVVDVYECQSCRWVMHTY